MTAVIAGGVFFVSIRCVVSIADSTIMLSGLIEVAFNRPYRSVTQGAGDQPEQQKKSTKHYQIIPRYRLCGKLRYTEPGAIEY
jgi:hypothetical protein